MNSPLRILRDVFLLTLPILVASAIGMLESCTKPDADFDIRLALVTSVTLPDSVQIGDIFTVIIVTEVGHGGCGPGHDDVHVTDTGYQIVPHDKIYVGPDLVDTAIHSFNHSVNLSLENEGVAEIQIRSRFPCSTGADSTGTIVRYIVAIPGI